MRTTATPYKLERTPFPVKAGKAWRQGWQVVDRATGRVPTLSTIYATRREAIAAARAAYRSH